MGSVVCIKHVKHLSSQSVQLRPPPDLNFCFLLTSHFTANLCTHFHFSAAYHLLTTAFIHLCIELDVDGYRISSNQRTGLQSRVWRTAQKIFLISKCRLRSGVLFLLAFGVQCQCIILLSHCQVHAPVRSKNTHDARLPLVHAATLPPGNARAPNVNIYTLGTPIFQST